MARKLIYYRFRDGQTTLDEKELNKRFFDIDARLHALELLSISWQEAVSQVQNEGLKRINELIIPVLEQAQEELSQIQSDWDELKQQIQSDYEAWSEEKINALDEKIEEVSNLMDSIQQEWQNILNEWDNIGGTVTQLQEDVMQLQEDLSDHTSDVLIHRCIFESENPPDAEDGSDGDIWIEIESE